MPYSISAMLWYTTWLIQLEINIRVGKVSKNKKKQKKNILKSTKMSGITNIKQYKRNIRIALIYAAGTLRLNKEIESKSCGFWGRWIRRKICT